jgi:DNA-binding CsgD family transcriptional regulator
VCSMGIITGFLRGYPDGTPITFTPATRFFDFLLIEAICASAIMIVLKGKFRLPVVSLWVLMQVLASAALILYASLPQSLYIGAIFTTCLNSIMVVYSWYVIIQFMGFGWRSPYYYCIAGWLVWLGSRSLARIVLLTLYPIDPNGPLINAFLSALLLLSTQMIFMQFFSSLLQKHTQEEETFSRRSALTKLMGLDGNQSFSDIRQVSMRRNSEEMGKQFMLSEREIDVLALYALGYTQKRVADELCVSPGTAHAHIKHLYTKTGMHSRQEILDYMEHYTS